MSWLHKNLKSGLMLLFGTGEITASLQKNRTEDIRQSMLAEIGHLGDARCPRVTRRICYATDAHGLWYARGDLMEVLAAVHGETAAREKINRISAEFKGLLPSGMNTRPSSLTL